MIERKERAITFLLVIAGLIAAGIVGYAFNDVLDKEETEVGVGYLSDTIEKSEGDCVEVWTGEVGGECLSIQGVTNG